MDNHYGGVIWTNHALTRLKERGIKQGDAWATWRNPQQSRRGTVPCSWIYYRNYGTDQIEVVSKKNEKGEWLILSVWSRKVYTKGIYVKDNSQRSSIWRSLYNFLFKS